LARVTAPRAAADDRRRCIAGEALTN